MEKIYQTLDQNYIKLGNKTTCVIIDDDPIDETIDKYVEIREKLKESKK